MGRLKNYRSGDLNEEYGLFLLRNIGAVAPVPRSEDVGIDVFVTLLRDFGSMYRPETTVVVQLKSDGAKPVYFNYDDKEKKAKSSEQLKWLRELDLPLFFGQVSRVDKGTNQPGKLKLYSSHLLYEWLYHNPEAPYVGVCFQEGQVRSASSAFQERFDEELKKNEQREPSNEPSAATASKAIHEAIELLAIPSIVWLGPPIIEIDLVSIQDEKHRDSVLDVIDAWAKFLNENRLFGPIGILTKADCVTGRVPQKSKILIGNSPYDKQANERVLRHSRLPLMALLVERMSRGLDSDIEKVYEVIEILERLGVGLNLNDREVRDWTAVLRRIRESFEAK